MSGVTWTEEEGVWNVVRDLFKYKNLVSHQIESYNHFIDTLLPHILNESSDISYKHSNGKISHHISFSNTSVNPPTTQEADSFHVPITPKMCRLRQLTYSSCVTVDVIHDRVAHVAAHEPQTSSNTSQMPSPNSDKTTLISRNVYRNVVVAKIPVMVGSKLCYTKRSNDDDLSRSARDGECAVDEGGYFIISGNEKVLIPQCKLKTNTTFIFTAKSGDSSKFSYMAEVRSVHEAKLRSTSTVYILINDILDCDTSPTIVCRLPFLKSPLSLFSLFVVLGTSDIEQMLSFVPCADQDVAAIIRLCLERDGKACRENGTNGTDGEESREDLVDKISKSVTTDATRTTKESRDKYIKHITLSEIFPHMGVSNTPETGKKKMVFLGAAVAKLVSVALGKRKPDDRDDFENKRVDSAGTLLALLVRQHHRGNLLRKMSTALRKNVESAKENTFNAGDLVSHKLITSGLRYAFSTGTWGIQRGVSNSASAAAAAGANGAAASATGGGQTGVVQILPRLTTMAALGALRKVNVPISREGRTTGPRMLHLSSWGFVCPSDTPEGVACGLVSNLAMTTIVRVGCPMQPIALVLLSLRERGVVAIEDATSTERKEGVPLHVNGTIVAFFVGNNVGLQSLTEDLRDIRRNSCIPFDVSIALSDDGLFLSCDSGALLRPVVRASHIDEFFAIACEPDTFGLNRFEKMLLGGIIEYIDSSETKNCRIAVRFQDVFSDKIECAGSAYTHVEIHPSLIVGVCVSLIPFFDHNQSPRVAYQAAQCKQAIGIYTTNFIERMDTIAHVLVSPQRALVTTRFEEMLTTSVVRSGAVPIVAIMSYSGFNQDDSILVNRSSIERGLFHTFSYHTHRDEEHDKGADLEKFENPMLVEGCRGLKNADYSKIRDDGMPKIGTTYKNGDVLIGKTIAMSSLQADASTNEVRRSVKRDRSLILKVDEDVVVDAIFTTKTAEGNNYVKVRTRALRIPIVGDKYSSRHGQKGVCGHMFNAADMPYSADTGVQPDIIINPHAIPSRMTIGMILEMVLGKLACVDAECKDGTPFCGASLDEISDALEKHGYNRSGSERMINGLTGEELESEIFIAPCYYQRLKHMAIDKCHSRARGAKQLLTRAPVDGRAKEGGLRIGEMEKDAICSHGASHVLLDRLCEQSDAFSMRLGDEGSLTLPYAMKLLLQEIQACGINYSLRF